MAATGVMLLTEQGSTNIIQNAPQAASIGIGVALLLIGIGLGWFARMSPHEGPRRDKLAMSGWAVGLIGVILLGLGWAAGT